MLNSQVPHRFPKAFGHFRDMAIVLCCVCITFHSAHSQSLEVVTQRGKFEIIKRSEVSQTCRYDIGVGVWSIEFDLVGSNFVRREVATQKIDSISFLKPTKEARAKFPMRVPLLKFDDSLSGFNLPSEISLRADGEDTPKFGRGYVFHSGSSITNSSSYYSINVAVRVACDPATGME